MAYLVAGHDARPRLCPPPTTPLLHKAAGKVKAHKRTSTKLARDCWNRPDLLPWSRKGSRAATGAARRGPGSPGQSLGVVERTTGLEPATLTLARVMPVSARDRCNRWNRDQRLVFSAGTVRDRCIGVAGRVAEVLPQPQWMLPTLQPKDLVRAGTPYVPICARSVMVPTVIRARHYVLLPRTQIGRSASGLDGEELPRSGNTFELVFPAVFELEA